MKKELTNKVVDFDKDFSLLEDELEQVNRRVNELKSDFDNDADERDELFAQLAAIPGLKNIVDTYYDDEIDYETIDKDLNKLLELDFKEERQLAKEEVVVGIVAGIVASIIDIVFVGTPEVVKVYKGGFNFDGSILTEKLRDLGNKDGELLGLFNWFEENCKVPYDIPVFKNVVNPNNHRLRSPAHDPLFGLFFAVADIIMGTTTTIDNTGHLRILVNDKTYPDSEKILSVLYYLGHIVSDICTFRGLPVPGFFLTQFFVDGGDHSIARKAERMYLDGYDLRHFASMSIPVIVKNIIIDTYLYFVKNDNKQDITGIADKEIDKQKNEAYKNKIMLISDVVACSGNVLKFYLPPTCGNITALNIPEWLSFIKHGINVIKYETRDKTVEEILHNRDIINKNWESLLEDAD